MKATLLITTYNRDGLLEQGLTSITRQDLTDIEVIVINDGLKGQVENICKFHRVKYLYTGTPKWRIPGFAINIAAKQALGEILIISCKPM